VPLTKTVHQIEGSSALFYALMRTQLLRRKNMIIKFAFRSLVAVVFAGIASASQSAETLTAYAEKCKQELEINAIPGYSCLSGISIPGNTGFGLSSFNNYLGKVYTDNPNVDAIFLCRDTSGGTAGLNGYILQNRVTGKTCFFDAKKNVSINVPAIDGSAAAVAAWSNPADMVGTCVQCHSADPYIVTTGLAQAFSQLKLNYNGRRLMERYFSVGSSDLNSHFFNWDTHSNIDQSSNCAASCHRKAGTTASSITDLTISSGAMPVAWGQSNFHQFYEQNPLDKVSLKKKYRLHSGWNQAWDKYLNNEQGAISATTIQPSWHSAIWSFEKNDEGYYLIKNYWKPREFLNIENGPLVVGPAIRGWWSAQWTLVEVTDVPVEQKGKVFLLQNRWQPNVYINVENFQLKASTIAPGWHSARWYLESVEGL
jgi:hypothetical protein